MLTGHLNFENKTDYQFIYSTLHWVSFYCIYAKLTTKNGKLISLNLHLENYKGTPRSIEDINRVEFQNGVLRIGATIPVSGNNNMELINVEHLNITKENLKAIFFTRGKNHFDGLSTYSPEELISLTEEIEYTEETDFYNSIIYSGEKFGVLSHKSKKEIAAVGRNCRTSFIKVQNF